MLPGFDRKTIAVATLAIFTSAAATLAQSATPEASATSEITSTEVVTPNYWDPRTGTDRPTTTPNTIRFLAADDFPPFAFRDGTGRLTGFNIDLARAICEELEAACSLRIKSFDALVPALDGEEGDAIIAGLATTPGNVQTLLFSDPYLRLPARFSVLKGKTLSVLPEDLVGKRISVVEGTVHERFLRSYFSGAEIRTYPTATEARAALGTEEVDAHFGDGLSLSFWLNGKISGNCCEFVGGPWLEPGYFDHGLSIALRRDDALRQAAVNHALARLQAKGVYSELYLRYFPVSFY